jgi:hypothetical protein
MTTIRSSIAACLVICFAAASLGGCAVASIAGAAAGAAIEVTGAVVATGVRVTGKVVEKTVDVVTPSGKAENAPSR